MQQQLLPPRPPAQSRTSRATYKPLNVARLVLFPLVLLLTALAALPSLIIGLLLWWRASTAFDRREFWRGLWAAAVFGVICYAVWVWLADPLPWLWGNLLTDITRHLLRQAAEAAGLLWLFNLWLAPLVAPLAAGLSPRGLLRAKPKSGAGAPKQVHPAIYEREENEQATRQLAQFERMSAALQEPPQQSQSQSAPAQRHQGQAAVMVAPQEATLGTYQGGELADLIHGGRFSIPPELLELHGVIAGEPKAGKTTTLLRLAAIAATYGRRVIYLDLKGSRKTAALFMAAMAELGVSNVRLYPLQAYDGWRGDGQALYNKLMQQISPASHPFYREGVGSAVVSLAVKAPGGPPRSSYQFLERLDSDWLKAAYANDAQALREIRDLAPHIGGAALMFAGFFRGIAGALDGQWSYEDAQACYIGIDGVAHREEAAILGRFLLDDAAHFASVRKAHSEQAILIIDEFGVLESTNATGLYEQVREAGMSVWASGQSYQSLGRERDALLAASAVKILHRTGAPEPFVRYAGEREIYKFSRSVGGGEEDEAEDLLHPLANRPDSQGGIMRPDKEYSIRIEDVQQLAPGRVAIITRGQGAYVQIEPLQIPPALLQTVSRFIQTAPRFTPAPPPQLPPQAKPQSQRNQSQGKQQKRKPAAGGTTKRPQRSQLSPPAAKQAGPGQQPKPQGQGNQAKPAAPQTPPPIAPASQQAQQQPAPAPGQQPPQEEDDFFS